MFTLIAHFTRERHLGHICRHKSDKNIWLLGRIDTRTDTPVTAAIINQPGPSTLDRSVLGMRVHWRHNERDGDSKHRRLHCLLNCWFRRRSKKTSELRVTGLCAGNSSVTGEFHAQNASDGGNVSIRWRHHEHSDATKESWRLKSPTTRLFVYQLVEANEKITSSYALLGHWEGNTPVGRGYYNDVTMTTVASQITSLTVVYWIVFSGADQRKHQSSVSLAFVWGIHRDRWIPRKKGQ